MLKKTMNTKENVDVNQCHDLKNVVKVHAKGYKPQKALVFTWENV